MRLVSVVVVIVRVLSVFIGFFLEDSLIGFII